MNTIIRKIPKIKNLEHDLKKMRIKEGKGIIKIKKANKISKQMGVFYNPIMKLNRDISILLLDSIENGNMQIGLPFSGSGIRGIMFLKGLDKNIVHFQNYL